MQHAISEGVFGLNSLLSHIDDWGNVYGTVSFEAAIVPLNKLYVCNMGIFSVSGFNVLTKTSNCLA